VAQAAPYYSSAAADRSESATRRSESDGRKECGDRAHAMHTAAVSHQRKFADSAETAAAAALLLTSSRSSTSSSLSSQTSLTSVTSLTHIQSVPRQPLNSVYRLSLRTATVAASTHQLTSSAARLASTRHPPSPSLLFPLRLSLLSEHAASICLPWTWGEVMARSHHQAPRSLRRPRTGSNARTIRGIQRPTRTARPPRKPYRRQEVPQLQGQDLERVRLCVRGLNRARNTEEELELLEDDDWLYRVLPGLAGRSDRDGDSDSHMDVNQSEMESGSTRPAVMSSVYPTTQAPFPTRPCNPAWVRDQPELGDDEQDEEEEEEDMTVTVSSRLPLVEMPSPPQIGMSPTLAQSLLSGANSAQPVADVYGQVPPLPLPGTGPLSSGLLPGAEWAFNNPSPPLPLGLSSPSGDRLPSLESPGSTNFLLHDLFSENQSDVSSFGSGSSSGSFGYPLPCTPRSVPYRSPSDIGVRLLAAQFNGTRSSNRQLFPPQPDNVHKPDTVSKPDNEGSPTRSKPVQLFSYMSSCQSSQTVMAVEHGMMAFQQSSAAMVQQLDVQSSAPRFVSEVARIAAQRVAELIACKDSAHQSSAPVLPSAGDLLLMSDKDARQVISTELTEETVQHCNQRLSRPLSEARRDHATLHTHDGGLWYATSTAHRSAAPRIASETCASLMLVTDSCLCV
jgi:hypothetical protein